MSQDWEGVLSEQALMERYGLTERQLQALRARGLPFIAVSLTTRLYEEDATVGFLVGLIRTAERKPKAKKSTEG